MGELRMERFGSLVGSPDESYPQVLEICKLVGREDGIFHCGGASVPALRRSFSTITSRLSQLLQQLRRSTSASEPD